MVWDFGHRLSLAAGLRDATGSVPHQSRTWQPGQVPAVEVVRGDITTQGVDAIVNAANSSLMGGGGVDGAIHAAAGPRLLAACREIRRQHFPAGLPVGEAVATPGFALPATWVIHTVGPNAHRGERDPGQLAACFTRSLEVAADLGATTVAMPAVSAGVYGWDADEVARIAVSAVRDQGTGSIRLVRFVLFSERVFTAFERALNP